MSRRVEPSVVAEARTPDFELTAQFFYRIYRITEPEVRLAEVNLPPPRRRLGWPRPRSPDLDHRERSRAAAATSLASGDRAI